MPKVRRTVIRLVAGVMAAAGAVSMAVVPAYADVLSCTPRLNKIVSHPFRDADTQVFLEVCVRSAGTQREAGFALVSFHSTIAPGYNGKIFDYFGMQVRLERNGAVYKSARCNFTYQAHTNGWWGPYTCKSGIFTSALRGGWTGDGFVEWNFKDDDVGAWRWQLPDSPAIS